MTAALRLVQPSSESPPTPEPVSATNTRRPTARPATTPTLHSLQGPVYVVRETEPPMTKRSASSTALSFDEIGANEAKNLLAVMRLNVDFLESLLEEGQVSSLALAALADIDQSIRRLENRFDPTSASIGGSTTT